MISFIKMLSICHIIAALLILELLVPAFHDARASVKVVLLTAAVGLVHIVLAVVGQFVGPLEDVLGKDVTGLYLYHK